MPTTPLQHWNHALFREKEVYVYLKRDDLSDPHTGGNKRRKLLHILSAKELLGKRGIVSFGGPFSNHLVAVAASAQRLGLPSKGIVRGHPVDNPVLAWLRSRGMTLTFLSKPEYTAAQTELHEQWPDWLVIPMGGAHPLALEGVAELLPELRAQVQAPITHIAVPAGTGSTAAGLASALHKEETLLVFPAIKVPDLEGWFRSVLDQFGVNPVGTITVDNLAPGKGFARKDTDLWAFIHNVAAETGITFDPIYNGKMAQRIVALIQEDFFPRGSNVVLIHTGGWPGRVGYQHRYHLEPLIGAPELEPDFWTL
ncbi:MAG: pyridoxal-phosphate dependent enzyme [Saprospiraceae bacterium]|nr:pyridoxal-phosphate dependent enzyme [Saprospiraceae bacterium]